MINFVKLDFSFVFVAMHMLKLQTLQKTKQIVEHKIGLHLGFC